MFAHLFEEQTDAPQAAERERERERGEREGERGRERRRIERARLAAPRPPGSMPTSFVSSKLNIDPQMPFRVARTSASVSRKSASVARVSANVARKSARVARKSASVARKARSVSRKSACSFLKLSYAPDRPPPPPRSMPTSFVSSKLNIDPQMPFRGTQDLHARRPRKAALKVYRGTSIIRKRTPLGPYRRPMRRVREGS